MRFTPAAHQNLFTGFLLTLEEVERGGGGESGYRVREYMIIYFRTERDKCRFCRFSTFFLHPILCVCAPLMFTQIGITTPGCRLVMAGDNQLNGLGMKF